MRVKLSRLWFGPDGARYREGIHDLPASFKDKLPSGAKILEEPAPADDEESKPAKK